MLREVRISNLGVIREAAIELSPGLTVLTGETGAGKTMVVTAVNLLLGARADAALVRTGCEAMRVEGFVELPKNHPLRETVNELGGEVDSEVVLARVVRDSGRSRASIGGASVPISTLGEYAEQLVAVHGQADQWRLRSAAEHRFVLDTWAGAAVQERVAALQDLYAAWQRAGRELTQLRTTTRERLHEAELLRHHVQQIEAVAPQPGEEDQLRTVSQRLAHAEELQGAASGAAAALTGQMDGVPAASVLDLLAVALGRLAAAQETDPTLAPLVARLREVSVLAADLATDLSSYAASIEVDPTRLASVEERRAAISLLLRSYGDTAAEVLACADRAREQLLDLDTTDDQVVALTDQHSTLTTQVIQAASELSELRSAAAATLSSAIEAELTHLAMGSARVEVAVSQTASDAPQGLQLADGRTVKLSSHGIDEVDIRLASNPGTPARSITKAVSGGELSRVMLAIEVVTGRQGETSVPTFVFDEVDAGVGGASALEVGARLAVLAQHSQVVVVTHLAQVAAYADTHLLVRKSLDGQVTAADVRRLDSGEREAELARMMGGADTVAAQQHARELREIAATRRENDSTMGA